MGAEERLLETIEEEEGPFDRGTRQDRLARKNKSAITRFLGKGRRAYEVGIVPWYYSEVLSWALQRYLEMEKWQVTRTLKYHDNEPIFMDVNTSCDQSENLLMDGQILIQKGDDRFIVTVDLKSWHNAILIEGPVARKKFIPEFVTGVINLAREQNFYRGKNLELASKLRFLNLKDRPWESVILEEPMKDEIHANTIGFLNSRERWSDFGIPSKRGVLLAGEPGTGKTIICKALMAEASGITCITTSAYTLDTREYVSELYELAEDLKPSMVFIEDIDLIGQNREEFGYQRGNALLSLLSTLDGVEEHSEIVTVATTNHLETLDKALSQRPSRFDRVIRLSRPGSGQRRQLVDVICARIPLEEALREYLVHKTDGFTPAQIQEVLFSLVIERPKAEQESFRAREANIDNAISRISGHRQKQMGFCPVNGKNGKKPGLGDTVRLA